LALAIAPESQLPQQPFSEIDMLTPAAIFMIAYVLVLAVLITWFVRRHAKAHSVYRRRAAIIAKIRDEVDKDGPILGWMIRDDPAPVRPGRRVRDSN
jgi:hypothetical protein